MQIRPRSAQGLPTDRARRPACREGGMASPGTLPPAAGDASPPGPPDRQGAGAAYGFEFLLCKNCKTGVIIYKSVRSIRDIRHRVLPGRDPTAKPLAVGDILCATAPCYRCLIENHAALRTRSGGRKAGKPACLQNGRLPPVNRFRRPGLFRSLPSDIAIRNKQCPNRADRFTAHH